MREAVGARWTTGRGLPRRQARQNEERGAPASIFECARIVSVVAFSRRSRFEGGDRESRSSSLPKSSR